MITVIPALEVMKSMTDNNQESPASNLRRKAFYHAMDLKSLCDVDTLLDGVLFERILPRLEPDHQKFFQNHCRVDQSTVGLPEYTVNLRKSISWIALSESKARRVIILTENPQDYVGVLSQDIKAIKPEDFIKKINTAKGWHAARKFSDLVDAVTTAIFFDL